MEEGKKVLFSDETHFFVQGRHSKYVRISEGEKLSPMHFNQAVKHPEKKMFWGCFSFSGVGTLSPIEGMMNSARYTELIRRKVTRDMQRAFPEGGGVFQQDLLHASK